MLKTLMKTLISASFCLAALAPAGAAPLMVPKPAPAVESTSGVVQVRDHMRHDQRRNYGFYRHNNRGYYNGHRGYRHPRRGYRQYNGFWFPPAAFALGVIIGGALNNNTIVGPGYLNPRHVRWCDAKYRSYREWDNTFQPYHGPRRECRSPYY